MFMSKNKDSLNDKIIALRTDHSITLHDIDEVSDITKDKGIEYLLVSVGTYSPEYLVIERDKFIRKFHKAYMKLLLSIEIYCDGMCINTDLKKTDKTPRIVVNNDLKAINNLLKRDKKTKSTLERFILDLRRFYGW